MTSNNTGNALKNFVEKLRTHCGEPTANLEEFVRCYVDEAGDWTCPHGKNLFQSASGQETSTTTGDVTTIDRGATTIGDGASVPARDEPAAQSVTVDTKDLAMKVLLDSDENYTVSGYNVRAKQSFGEIYLGLDKGPEYDRQSTQINSAIQSLSAVDAFSGAMRATRDKLSANPSATDSEVFVSVLASLCTDWFDIPDGTFSAAGGARTSAPTLPALCPGDYSVPSATIFYSGGDVFLADGTAQAFGGVLKEAHVKYVAQLRAAEGLPKGVLSRAIFAAFSEAEDELIARSQIGIMMGMLPTVFFNLKFIMDAWRADNGKMFASLREELGKKAGDPSYCRAYNVLSQPMKQAIQGNPMPPEVWRTAVKDHQLGSENISKGDRVVVDIAAAAAEDLGRGKTDVFVVFGGDRSALKHPTHACPGYEAAMAVMLGVINGLMEPS